MWVFLFFFRWVFLGGFFWAGFLMPTLDSNPDRIMVQSGSNQLE